MGNSTKPTRFRGPTVVSLRGAGSQGHESTVGAGSDVGLDVQVPTNQTANCIQITKPDGTVIYSIGPNGAAKIPNLLAASGAVPVRPPADYVITKAGVAALTLAAPTAGTDDGVTISIISSTLFAHTLTATGLLSTGTASVNVATFAAFAGAGLTLKAYNGLWLVTSSVGITFS